MSTESIIPKVNPPATESLKSSATSTNTALPQQVDQRTGQTAHAHLPSLTGKGVPSSLENVLVLRPIQHAIAPDEFWDKMGKILEHNPTFSHIVFPGQLFL